MAPDIEQRIEADFGPGALNGIAPVLAPLFESSGGERIARCVLILAAGDIAKLRHFATQARQDFRDVIYWAEYDAQGRIRDCGKPFPCLI